MKLHFHIFFIIYKMILSTDGMHFLLSAYTGQIDLPAPM